MQEALKLVARVLVPACVKAKLLGWLARGDVLAIYENAVMGEPGSGSSARSHGRRRRRCV